MTPSFSSKADADGSSPCTTFPPLDWVACSEYHSTIAHMDVPPPVPFKVHPVAESPDDAGYDRWYSQGRFVG